MHSSIKTSKIDNPTRRTDYAIEKQSPRTAMSSNRTSNATMLLALIFIGVTAMLPTTTAQHQEHPAAVGATRTASERRAADKDWYYVCPPEFIRRGNQCYFLSALMATWQDAHYNCQDKYAELVSIGDAHEDRRLRNYLNKPELARVERWIGGRYSWKQMVWTWGKSGKAMSYKGFSKVKQNETTDDLQWQCVILDPGLNYKWGHRSCVEGKHYICQHPLQKLNKAGRRDFRKKYNMTNPNERLNAIPVPGRHRRPPKTRKPIENRTNGNDIAGGADENNLKSYHPKGDAAALQRDAADPAGGDQQQPQFGHRPRATLRKSNVGRKQRIRNRCRQQDRAVRRHVGENATEEECVHTLMRIWQKKRLRKQRRARGSVPMVEHITHRTLLLSPRISDIHPQQIAEIHDV